MKNDDIIMWEQYISESPWLVSSLPDSLNDYMYSLNIDKILSYKYVGDYKNYNIYENKINDEYELFFILKNILVAYYRYNISENNNIQTKLSWCNKSYKGTFLDIFANYIVPKFKIVESDNMMTSKAFDMWKSLILLKPEYKFYAKLDDKLIKLTSPYDVYTYSERIDTNNQNSTFIVTI